MFTWPCKKDVNSEQVVFLKNWKRRFLNVTFFCLLRFLNTCRSNFPTHTFGKEHAFPVLAQFRLFPDRLAHSISVLAARLAQKPRCYRSHQLTRCSHTPDDVCIIPLCCTVKVDADRSRLEAHIRKDTCSWTSLSQTVDARALLLYTALPHQEARRTEADEDYLRFLENLENLGPFRVKGKKLLYMTLSMLSKAYSLRY